jgi:heat shock protein HslJ
MRRTITLLAAATLVLAACGDADEDGSGNEPTTPSSPVADQLVGREFLSTDLSGRDLVAGSTIRLNFDADSLGVHAGCNSMGGGWSLDGNALVVGAMFSTEMACDQPLMDQDSWLSEFLQSRPTLALDGDELTLTGTSETLTLLDRRVADPDRPIEGTRWEVDSLISNDAVSSIPLGTAASITFADGQASVEAGCNTGFADAVIDATTGTIELGPLALTKMMCEEPAMELEAAVSAIFGQTVTFEVEAGRLTLTAAESGLGLAAAD